jgi:hypothetical protein
MNKNHRLVFGQYDIWLTRQILNMKPEPKPIGVEKPADKHLRLGVFPADPGHIIGTGGLGMYICHIPKLSIGMPNGTVLRTSHPRTASSVHPSKRPPNPYTFHS